MAILDTSEYDAYYFEGASQTYLHNAGFSNYSRCNYKVRSTRFVNTLEESTGTYFGDLIKGMNIKLNNRFIGKKVLVLGCAYGWEVQELRNIGCDAWGLDCSQFAYNQADPAVQPYLEVVDVRQKMPTYKRNSWDYIFSRWFLECMSDADLATLIPDMNNACKSDQLHIISTISPVEYYNIKTLEQWVALPFKVGTILVVNDDFDNYLVKIN